MTQTILAREENATAGPHFEGIGPYARQQFRLMPPPATSRPAVPAPHAAQTESVFPGETDDIEALEQRVSVSARWCDVGLSLLILASGAAALFRLVSTGQP